MTETTLADLPLWSDDDAHSIMKAICDRHGIPLDVMQELVQVQRERQHQERAHGVYDRIAEILGRVE
jgi:hypothetical protein